VDATISTGESDSIGLAGAVARQVSATNREQPSIPARKMMPENTVKARGSQGKEAYDDNLQLKHFNNKSGVIEFESLVVL
jgi:hypothetical protein